MSNQKVLTEADKDSLIISLALYDGIETNQYLIEQTELLTLQRLEEKQALDREERG